MLRYLPTYLYISLHIFTYLYISKCPDWDDLSRQSGPWLILSLRYSTVMLLTHDLVRRWAAGHHRAIRRGQVLLAGDQLRAFFLQLACQRLETGYLILWLWQSLGVYGLCYTDCVAANNAADSFCMMQTIAHRRCSDIISNLSRIVAFAGPRQATWTWLGVSHGGGVTVACVPLPSHWRHQRTVMMIPKNILFLFPLSAHLVTSSGIWKHLFSRRPTEGVGGGSSLSHVRSISLCLFWRLQHILHMLITTASYVCGGRRRLQHIFGPVPVMRHIFKNNNNRAGPLSSAAGNLKNGWRWWMQKVNKRKNCSSII